MISIKVKRRIAAVITAGALIMLDGCQTNSKDQALATNESQVKLRSFQTRAFDTNEKLKTLRTVMATMQDLGFVLDKADSVLGSVSGTKFGSSEYGYPYQVRMTVTVRPRGEKQTLVRANAQYGLTAIEDPMPYRDFFVALEKAMFLTAQKVD